MNAKEKGSALVEFALVANVFFMVLFGILEFSLVYWVNLTMQNAVREGARFAAVTGPSNYQVITPTLQNPNPPTQAQQRCNAVVQAIMDKSMGLYSKVSPSLVYSTVDPATGNIVTISSGCGSASQIIMIKLTGTIPLTIPSIKSFFPNGAYKFTVGATMQNESFK